MVAPLSPADYTCWICLQTKDDDLAEGVSRVWKRPCKCSMVAHEDCLLDWVNEQSAVRNTAESQKKSCPQCHAEIRVATERSRFLSLRDKIDAIQGPLVGWSAVSLVGATVGVSLYSALYSYGAMTVRCLYPADTALKLLGVTLSADGKYYVMHTLSFKKLTYLSSIPFMLISWPSDNSYSNSLYGLMLPLTLLDGKVRSIRSLTGDRFVLALVPLVRYAYYFAYDRIVEPFYAQCARRILRTRDLSTAPPLLSQLLGVDINWEVNVVDDNANGQVDQVVVEENGDEPARVAAVEGDNNDMVFVGDAVLAHVGALAGLQLNGANGNAEAGRVAANGNNQENARNAFAQGGVYSSLVAHLIGAFSHQPRGANNWVYTKIGYLSNISRCLAWPLLTGAVGKLLSKSAIANRLIPEKFARNMAVGLFIWFLGDLSNVATAYLRTRQAELQVVLNYDE